MHHATARRDDQPDLRTRFTAKHVVGIVAVAMILVIGGLTRDADAKSAPPALAKGYSWTATVYQKDQVSPDPTSREFATVYANKVTSKTKKGYVVHAHQKDGEGPAAAGYDLVYVKDKKGAGYTLIGGKAPKHKFVGRKNVRLLVGQNFPLLMHISVKPKSYKIHIK